MTTEAEAGPAPTVTPADAALLAVLKTFDAASIRQAATDMIEGLQLHIDGGLKSPEDLWYKIDRTAQVMKLAWMLESPGMAKGIGKDAPKGDLS